jgi:hypothetical protein
MRRLSPLLLEHLGLQALDKKDKQVESSEDGDAGTAAPVFISNGEASYKHSEVETTQAFAYGFEVLRALVEYAYCGNVFFFKKDKTGERNLPVLSALQEIAELYKIPNLEKSISAVLGNTSASSSAATAKGATRAAVRPKPAPARAVAFHFLPPSTLPTVR